MYQRPNTGWIEVITGVMFSGKSEEMIRRVRRSVLAHKRVQVFKSRLDDRYRGVSAISTHDGSALEAVPINSADQILKSIHHDTSVLAVDEVQFLGEEIVSVAQTMAERGLRVILAGTDLDFRGQPFGPIPDLLAIAEVIHKLHAICVICGQAATRNQRLIDGSPAPMHSPTILVGGGESYEARCRSCHTVPDEDLTQAPLFGRSPHTRARR